MTNFTPSTQFFALLKIYEGCRLTAYQDTGGIWTIGYGHTANVKAGDSITQEQAEAYLLQDCKVDIAVLNQIGSCRSQNQFDACLDLMYNIGCGTFSRDAALRAALLSQDKEALTRAFMAHDMDRQKHLLLGLENRRQKELALFFTPNM
jgi:lysozyme